jgi:nucleoid DNA-binding protein
MNKSELISFIVAKSELKKKQVNKVINRLIKLNAECLKKNGFLSITWVFLK